MKGELENGAQVELSCSIKNENGVAAKSYSWIRYPSLPKSAETEEDRLSIKQFDSQEDSGLYMCRASTDEHSYETTHLVASNDFLLSHNSFFKFTAVDDETVNVKCRPGKE